MTIRRQQRRDRALRQALAQVRKELRTSTPAPRKRADARHNLTRLIQKLRIGRAVLIANQGRSHG